MTAAFNFQAVILPESAQQFRAEIRRFNRQHLTAVPLKARVQTWSFADQQYSKKLAAKKWLGLTWPKQYGGSERSALDRFVLTEELLAAGAPCGWHWIGDRQSGPLIIKYGNSEQKQLLPKIAAAEVNFSIGMSEPNSGSDLASIQSTAKYMADGWLLNGEKIWTSGGTNSTHIIGLFRSDSNAPKHRGLSQFVIDLSDPAIEKKPITDMTGEKHFSQVYFKDVLVPHSSVLGEPNEGWKQVMGELVYERSGPERFMSCCYTLGILIQQYKKTPMNTNRELISSNIGSILARMHALRCMSQSVATQVMAGQNPALQAALVKDRGAVLEQSILEFINLLKDSVELDHDVEEAINLMALAQFSFSLRGGTSQILKGIIAKGIGLS